jgi:hypothetical protein
MRKTRPYNWLRAVPQPIRRHNANDLGGRSPGSASRFCGGPPLRDRAAPLDVTTPHGAKIGIWRARAAASCRSSKLASSTVWPRARKNTIDARCTASSVRTEIGNGSKARARTGGTNSISARWPISARGFEHSAVYECALKEQVSLEFIIDCNFPNGVRSVELGEDG